VHQLGFPKSLPTLSQPLSHSTSLPFSFFLDLDYGGVGLVFVCCGLAFSFLSCGFFLLFDSSSTVLMIVSYNTCCLGLTLIPSICLALPLLALPRPKATRVRLTILMDTGTDADTTDLSIENRLGEKTSIAAIRSRCSFGLPIHWFVDQACE
jgi:hypothetical protein